MPVSRARDAVLLITHPGGGKSFNYEDYWDEEDLIYTGRGKLGDQSRTGPNLDVAENRRALFAFEASGSKRLIYLGNPVCVEERTARAPGDDGVIRDVLQFRLKFTRGEGRRWATTPEPPEARSAAIQDVQRTPRPFQSTKAPRPAAPIQRAEPEDLQVKQEKAQAGHAQILSNLHRILQVSGWRGIEEIPAAVDLWATDPSGERVLFEAKTITSGNELTQCRGGFAQLMEYRVEYGRAEDRICLVVDHTISARRARLLSSLGIAVLIVNESHCAAANDAASALAGRLAQLPN